MIEGAIGWFFILLGIFIIGIGLLLVYRIRIDYEIRIKKWETLAVQSVSLGVVLIVIGIVVVYMWDMIVSPIHWLTYLVVAMLLGLIVYCSPAVIRIKFV